MQMQLKPQESDAYHLSDFTNHCSEWGVTTHAKSLELSRAVEGASKQLPEKVAKLIAGITPPITEELLQG